MGRTCTRSPWGPSLASTKLRTGRPRSQGAVPGVPGLLAPADRRLHFGELFQSEVTAFTTQARLLVAAERRAHAALCAIDMYVAGAQFLRNFARFFLRALHISREAVRCIVG